MSCKYKNGGRCELLTTFRNPNGFHVPEAFCETRCGSNISAQIAMMKRFGVVLPQPPEGRDLLEWAKECVANGTVKMPPQAEAIQKQKAEQAKAMAELPPWFEQIDWARKHAVEIAAYKLRTGRILVSPEQKAERLTICDDCEKLWVNPKTQKKKCSTCGCSVMGLIGDKYGKADFEALTCGPWKEIDEKFLAEQESDSTEEGKRIKRV